MSPGEYKVLQEPLFDCLMCHGSSDDTTYVFQNEEFCSPECFHAWLREQNGSVMDEIENSCLDTQRQADDWFASREAVSDEYAQEERIAIQEEVEEENIWDDEYPGDDE